MGGKSSSKTSSVSTKTTTNKNENISGIEDSTLFSKTGDISILDGDAINSAFDFGDEVIAGAIEFGESSLNTASEGLDQLLDFGTELADGSNKQLTDTLKSVTAAAGVNANLNQQDLNQTLVKIAYAIAAVAAVFVVSKWVKA